MPKHIHALMLVDKQGKTIEQISQHNDISMAYKSPGTLLARQIFSLGLALIEDRGEPRDGDENFETGLVSVFTIDDVEELGIGKEEKNLGESLSATLNNGNLVRQWVVLQPGDKGPISLVRASWYDYRTGKIYIEYDYKSKSKLLNVTGNYTNIKLAMLAEFGGEASLNLFEYLYSRFCLDLWKESDPEIADVSYEYTLHVQELRLLIGMDPITVQNATQSTKLTKELAKGKPDFEKIGAIIQDDKKNDRWNHFKNRILNPAIEELKNLTECPIKVSADFLTSGGTRKITHVKFTVSRNKDVELYSRAVSAAEFSKYCDGAVTRTEATRLLVAAKDDIKLLKNIYNEKVKGRDIANVSAYIRSILLNGAGKKNSASRGKAYEKTGYSYPATGINADYPQHHYTDEQIAEMERKKLRPNEIRGGERQYTEDEIKTIEMKKLGITPKREEQ